MRKIAATIPVSDQMIADSSLGLGRFFLEYVTRMLRRRLIAGIFGEDWSSPEAEGQRLEVGRTWVWDSPIRDECDCDC